VSRFFSFSCYSPLILTAKSPKNTRKLAPLPKPAKARADPKEHSGSVTSTFALNQRLFDGTDSSLPLDVAAELEGLITDALHDAAEDARLEERAKLVGSALFGQCPNSAGKVSFGGMRPQRFALIACPIDVFNSVFCASPSFWVTFATTRKMNGKMMLGSW